MKKMISLVLALAMLLGLTACGSTPAEAPDSSDAPPVGSSGRQPEEQAPAEDQGFADTMERGKTLVVYFSLPETDDPNDMTREEENSTVVIDGQVLGNTQYVACVIQENTGADIFRIEPAIPYTTDHEALVDLALAEQNDNARPAIAGQIENLDEYDVIFIGYPIWWSDLPMILYTFLEQYDLSGKTVAPFSTHGGSGLAGTISTIKELQPDANVLEDGFTVSRNSVAEAGSDVAAWLAENGFIQ